MKFSKLRPGARALIATTVVAGAAAVALRIPDAIGWTRDQILAAASLAAAMAVVEQFSITLRFKSENLFFSLTDALWAAGLMLTSGSVLSIALAVGVLSGQLVKRVHPLKAAFNVGVYLVGITGAEAIYSAFGHPSAQQPRAWLAAGLGMALVFVLNTLLVSLVIALVERKPFASILVPPLLADFLHRMGNLELGIVIAVEKVLSPKVLPVSIILLGTASIAYRSLVQGVRERERLRDMYEAGRLLMKPLRTNTDFQPFLEVIRRMFQAGDVELSLMGDGNVVVYSAGDHQRAAGDGAGPDGHTAGVATEAEAAEATEAAVGAKASPHVTLVRNEEGVRAVLAIHRPQPLTEEEHAVVEAIASQISTMLENQQLFVETMQKAELAEVVTHTWDGIFLASPDGAILSWNPAMERLTGYPSSEALGRCTSELLGLSLATDPAIASNGHGDGARRMVHDVVFTGKDDVARWIRYTEHAVGGQGGGVKSHAIVARDVTAELETERAKADLVATVSHELRTPLTPLKGFLITLLRGCADESPEERQEYYRIMLNQTNRLETLVMNLLEASRIESGEPGISARRFDLASFARERLRAASEQHPDRRIAVAAPSERIGVEGDPIKLEHVLSNLLSNALKYAPKDSPIEIAVTAEEATATVTVRDHGPGIPAAEHARIFDRFYRVQNGITTNVAGSGLGLYIARQLVESMKGRLWVESHPGQGSTFGFTLPLAEQTPSSSGNGQRRAYAATN